MKKLLIIIVIFLLAIPVLAAEVSRDELLASGLSLLKSRQDNLAWDNFVKIIAKDPDNLQALWGEAEILRRQRKYAQSEELLNKVLKVNPDHAPSLISLCYIRYHDDKLNEGVRLAKGVLELRHASRQDKALAHLLIGTINSRKASRGGPLDKIMYGTQVRNYFEMAVNLSPDLAEVHLGLGTFYLLAPGLMGGDLDKAIEELQTGLKLAPDFATVNARLAQAYKKKGDLAKYELYFNRAKELDPQNEVIAEMQNEK